MDHLIFHNSDNQKKLRTWYQRYRHIHEEFPKLKYEKLKSIIVAKYTQLLEEHMDYINHASDHNALNGNLKNHIFKEIRNTYEILSHHIHITDDDIYQAALYTMYNMEHAKSILHAKNDEWGVHEFFQYFKDHHIQFPFARTPYSVHQLPPRPPPPPPLPSSHSSNSTNVGKDDDAMSTGSTTHHSSPTASSPLTRRNSFPL